MHELFGFIAGALVIIAYIPYIRDIAKGKTKPERASWLIWFLLGSILFFSQLAKGATNSLWLSAAENVGILIVLFLSIKNGIGGFTKMDLFGIIAAIAGLVLWYFTKEAAAALYIVLTVNFIAIILTIIKTYKHPTTETLSTWLIAGIGGVFALLAVGKWDVVLMSYPIYHLIVNFAVAFTILIGRGRKKK